MNMFYSQSLLSKKGSLRTIWIAAHFHKKLKKEQVKQTNIPSSVDKILLDEVSVVTYRIMAYLLLGIVRIYSKKVEYLFHDCRNVLTEICHFAVSKKAIVPIKAICAPYSTITLPETFELDAFDLDVLEDSSGGHVKSREEIMLEEAGKNEGIGPHSLIKYHCEEDATHFEACSSAHSPFEDTHSLYLVNDDMVVGPSHNLSNLEASSKKFRGYRFSLEESRDPMILGEAEEEPDLVRPFDDARQKNEASMEKLRGYRFSLEECLDPMILGEAEEEQDLVRPFDDVHQKNDTVVCPSHNLSNMEERMEKLRGYRFSLEESMDPMILGEAEEEPNLVRPFDEEHKTNEEQIKFPGSEMIIGEAATQIKFLEMTSLESEKLRATSENHPISITIDVPETKVPNVSGATSPEFMAVRTPATKEHSRVLKKRNFIFDDIIVFPNKVLKECINDSSDLVCKRRKAPHTALHAWKRRQISNLPHSFLEPSIPCISLDFGSLICQKKIFTPEPVETVETPKKIDELGSPAIHRSPDQEAIAPLTPVSHSASLRYSEIRGNTNLDRVGPATSVESSREKEPSSCEDQDFDINLLNEELNSCEGDSQENYKWSVKPRAWGRYLHRNFVAKNKRGEDETLNFSQLLKGKTKKESARLFFELLVLKSGGYVDVNQNNTYDDIFVLETLKLKQACEADGAMNPDSVVL